MNKNTKLLAEEKISKLLLRLSLPAAIGMIVMAFYNFVDTIFVGRAVGAIAIGGLAVVFPIQMLTMAFAQAIGIGGSSIISRSLGAKDFEKAEVTFGNMLSLMFVLALAFTTVAYIFANEILVIFGAKGEIVKHAGEYFSIILWGIPLFCFAMMSNNIIRAEGNAKVAMLSMLLSAILNLILDPIFIFYFEWGIKGAAWSTVVAQLTTAIYIIYYFSSGKSVVKFKRENLKLKKSIVSEIFAIGASSFARQASLSIMSAILNHSLVIAGGEMAVAIFGAIHKVLAFVFMSMFGVIQGFMPIAGYNYGAGNFQRVRETISIAIKTTTIMATIGFLLLMLFARPILSVFSNELALIDGGEAALQIIVLAFPLLGFQLIAAGLFQALGKALPSFVLSILRQVLFLIPLVIIMPRFFGLNGIWFAFPIADVMSAVVCIFMLLPMLKMLKKKSESVIG